MEKLNKELLIHNMSVRQASLKHLIDKDITGNTLAFLEAWREVKYWKEALERGEYDVRENVEMNNHKAIFYGERRRVKYNV